MATVVEQTVQKLLFLERPWTLRVMVYPSFIKLFLRLIMKCNEAKYYPWLSSWSLRMREG